MITFTCPECGHKMQGDNRWAGRQGACTRCNIPLIVPTMALAPAHTPPALIPNTIPRAEPPIVTVNVINEPRASSFSIASIILGVCSLPISCIPLAGMVSFPLAGVGLILAIIGLSKKQSLGYSIAGMMICFLGIAMGLWWTLVTGILVQSTYEVSHAVNETSHSLSEVSNSVSNTSNAIGNAAQAFTKGLEDATAKPSSSAPTIAPIPPGIRTQAPLITVELNPGDTLEQVQKKIGPGRRTGKAGDIEKWTFYWENQPLTLNFQNGALFGNKLYLQQSPQQPANYPTIPAPILDYTYIEPLFPADPPALDQLPEYTFAPEYRPQTYSQSPSPQQSTPSRPMIYVPKLGKNYINIPRVQVPLITGQAAPNTQAQQNYTVYATKTGTKYHRSGCQYLSQSAIPMTLQQAYSNGLSPCSRCNP